MANAVIQRTPPTTLASISAGANSIGTSKSALVVGKTALACIGQIAQRGSGAISSLGQRAQNLGNLFGTMASGYAINDFGESLTEAVGGALELRRAVTTDSVLRFIGGTAMAGSDALGAIGFVASRGVVALGGAAVVIELLAMAALAIGATLMVVRALLQLNELRRQVAAQAGGATPEQQEQMSKLKWLAARMGMLATFGVLGVVASVTMPALALGVASTALITTFFATDLFLKFREQRQAARREEVPANQIVDARGRAVLYEDRLSAADAADPEKTRWAAQERTVQATGEFFGSIPGEKGVQGFIRGGSDAVAIVAELAGNEGLASAVSEAGGQIAGGMMPQAEVVGNAARLVTALQSTAEPSKKAVSVGITGGKVVADAAKLASTLTKFKVIDIAKEVLKPIDLVGKAADFTASLLTIAAPSRGSVDLTGHPGQAEIQATASKAKKWNQVGNFAKLTQTILALVPTLLAAFGRTAPGIILRAASTTAGLVMGVARTGEHYIRGNARYSTQGEPVVRLA